MSILGINNVSFKGRLDLYGAPSGDSKEWAKMKNRRGDNIIQYSLGSVTIDTDYIDHIFPRSKETDENVAGYIHVKKGKDCATIEISSAGNLPYDQILTAYTAACQKPHVLICAKKTLA